MTAMSGSAARSGPAEPPQAVDPADMEQTGPPPGQDAAELCEQARDLAESGHVARAAALYRRAAATGPGPRTLARALLGLAVTEDQRGDTAASREAARRAVATGDARYAPRAAYHLALSLEQGGEKEEAERTWLRLLDLGGAAYTAVARYGLARAAEARDDAAAAEEHWEAALSLPPDPSAMDRLHAATVVEAARDLAGRLLERGLPGAAVAAAERGLAVADDPGLRLARAAARLEHAVADLGAILERDPEETGGRAEPGTAGAAVEILAGLLALRGDPDSAHQVWRRGLEDPDRDTAAEVRRRLRLGFASQEREGTPPWWDPYLEEAVATVSAPALAGELFAALTQMHSLLALPLAEGEQDPARLRAAMHQALLTPSDLVWGPDLHADFRRRLGAAAGRDVLPQGWPDHS
ncbi:tetratricopeptide repeat protein [Nocardiopsis algeriensis]|uniref:tetratricopeptide repeat protein n=1 Tax=Nocardiopsis algeriensis TaxID=1478215 RepID=UPI003B4360D5